MSEKEKLLVTSNFFFSDSVSKSLVLQTRKKQDLFGKGFNASSRVNASCRSIEPGQCARTALAYRCRYFLLNICSILFFLHVKGPIYRLTQSVDLNEFYESILTRFASVQMMNALSPLLQVMALVYMCYLPLFFRNLP